MQRLKGIESYQQILSIKESQYSFDIIFYVLTYVTEYQLKDNDMCAERIQRFLMAIMLTVIMVLFMTGYSQIAVVLQTFVIIVVVIWAIADFCPSLWVLEKVFGPCKKK